MKKIQQYCFKNMAMPVAMLLLFFLNTINAQSVKPKFNFDFEQYEKNEQLPAGWNVWENYKIGKDTVVVYSGKHAVKIQATEGGNPYGVLVTTLPDSYEGKEIRLEGYMKTDNVEGFAGLFIRLDKNGSIVAFENMEKEGIAGTNDWKKYSIAVPNHPDASTIYVGALLSGKGQIWLDDFVITVDGKRIETISYPADNDITEFAAGSGFTMNKPTPQQLDNLYELGKTWGYLKYHHPEIAAGKYNMDYALFRALPIVKSPKFATDKEVWIASFGKMEPGKIKRSYYLGFGQADNPVFKNEAAYPDMKWADDGYKLLALFRYWNMIEYYFPYKHLIEKNWDSVLKKYIPKVLAAQDELTYKLTMMQLVSEIQDSHGFVFSAGKAVENFFGANIAPVELKAIEGKIVVTRLLNGIGKTTNLKVGDIITKINGVPVQKVIDDKKQYLATSNKATEIRDISRKLLRTNAASISVTVNNGKKDEIKKIASQPLKEVQFFADDTPSHKMLEGNIGYIYPGALQRGEIIGIMEKFKTTKGLVIDLRCYPSDFIVFSLGGYLMPKPTDFVKFAAGSLENPGSFKMSDKALQVGRENPDYYKGRIAILVNETTQSNAEYTTMALQVAPNAKVFGSQTAGADGNVSEIDLPGNFKTMITGLGVYYPDQRETQRIGIVPDVEVKPTRNGLMNDKDEVLERALRYVASAK
ncbi:MULTISPECIES: S41 family peptidase [unclassified Flavobacterium]|uniref:S41 family peptidase n=1 Tax=unclassified Flavobacterium TaxID=196869 RepID=UPI000AA465CE|nr:MULTISPECIES: S41 family peptidase [unclassified Flavobacterium]MBN9285518.1 PDZ domain-containing protein [Flavobacterium sp.]